MADAALFSLRYLGNNPIMTVFVRTDYFLHAYRRARGENQNKHSNVEDDDDDDDGDKHDDDNNDRSDNERFCATSSSARDKCNVRMCMRR